MSGPRISSDRGPWTATRPVASERSSSTARKPVEPLRQRVRDGSRVRGVGDDHEPVLGQAVDDEVVEDPAVRGADHRVVGTPDRERGRVADEGAGEGGACVLALDDQLAHVGQIEQPGRRSDRPVLLDDPRVLDRHQPARELDDLRAQALVAVEQRRLQRGGGLGHRGTALTRSPGTSRRLRPRPRGRRGRVRCRRSAGWTRRRRRPSAPRRTRGHGARGRHRSAP